MAVALAASVTSVVSTIAALAAMVVALAAMVVASVVSTIAALATVAAVAAVAAVVPAARLPPRHKPVQIRVLMVSMMVMTMVLLGPPVLDLDGPSRHHRATVAAVAMFVVGRLPAARRLPVARWAPVERRGAGPPVGPPAGAGPLELDFLWG
jgi:hypothetical protein